jgi:hypothetical protein
MYYKNGFGLRQLTEKKLQFYSGVRCIQIPGKHTIEFKFDPQVVKTGVPLL